MDHTARCPECHAVWRDNLTCRDHFDQMLAWEFEQPGDAGAVHHLTVLCYNLQHPSVYSPEALAAAWALLIDFVERGVDPQQARQRIGQSADSGARAHKIVGTSAAHGEYASPVAWSMTVGDVAARGLEVYGDRVRAWARSVVEALRESGNTPPPLL